MCVWSSLIYNTKVTRFTQTAATISSLKVHCIFVHPVLFFLRCGRPSSTSSAEQIPFSGKKCLKSLSETSNFIKITLLELSLIFVTVLF